MCIPFFGFPNLLALIPRHIYFFLLNLLLLSGAQQVHAQNPHEPFSTLELRLSGTQNVHRNFLHTYWQPGIGGDVALATPFYLGFAEAGVAYHRYRIDDPNVPAFHAVLLFAGWGLAAETNRLRLEGSFRIGNYRMSFDENTFAGVRNESELALGVQGRVLVQVVGPVSVHVAGSYMQAYTFLRLKLWYASAGLSYRLQTPHWAEEFLR